MPYIQNFDQLSSSGTTAVVGGLFPDGTNVMQGWAFNETGSNANSSYVAASGELNSGDTYSFGVAGTNALTERAFGTLQSSSLISVIGASFQNATTAIFDSILITYTGEQWRLGAASRPDRLDFQFSIDATSLSNGNWTDVNALDFVAPRTIGTLGALDGNAIANRVLFSNVVLPGLSLSPNATFWIRWTDFGASGNDDGLAIDDFTISSSSSLAAGVTITETAGTTAVNEGGATDSYSIVLQSAPTANVTISIAVSGQVVTSQFSFTFTPSNWSIAQLVTVTAIDDSIVEGTHFATISHSASSNDSTYSSITVRVLTVTINDNDGSLSSTNLRIVSYNIASEFGTIRTGLSTLLQGMASEIVSGVSRQLDLIALQEVDLVQTATSAIASQLNTIYGTGTYQTGSLAGLTTGAGTQGVVFNSRTLQLLGETTVGVLSTSGQARQTLRHHFQPIGGIAGTDFYVYNSHWKSADTQSDEARRLAEVRAIRSNSDALGDGKNVLYVGDFNVYRSSESGIQAITAVGNGQAFDPVDRLGNWSGNASFRDLFTQAPSANPPSGFTGGGLDDRFDFQFFTGELTDSTGLDYRSGSYRTFGNNGSVAVNGSINDPSNTALSGLANRLTLLNLLTTVSDHLPVVADYTVQSLSVSAVVNTQLFYRATGTNASIGNATNPTTRIDSSKLALQPGQTAASIGAAPGGNANYINHYSGFISGINGLVVDIANTTGVPTASDFEFRTWNGLSGTAATGFVVTSATPTVTDLGLVGASGSRRMKIEFADNAVKNTWLQVTVRANPATTGLSAPAVFYFGNAAGDVGDGNGLFNGLWRVTVTGTDGSSVLRAPTAPLGASISNNFDVGKNLGVSGTDRSQILGQAQGPAIRFFNVPAAPVAPSGFAPPVTPTNPDPNPDSNPDEILPPAESSNSDSSSAYFAVDEFFSELERKKSRFRVPFYSERAGQ